MSNLGGYLWLTKTAKKVGGPEKLVLLIVGAGALGYKGIEMLAKVSVRAIKKVYTNKKVTIETEPRTYIIKNYGVNNDGLTFNVGDEIKVLESDGKAVMIEKTGDSNNPYFISADLLREISDYEK